MQSVLGASSLLAGAAAMADAAEEERWAAVELERKAHQEAWAESEEHHRSAHFIQCQWRYRKYKKDRHVGAMQRDTLKFIEPAHHAKADAPGSPLSEHGSIMEFTVVAQMVARIQVCDFLALLSPTLWPSSLTSPRTRGGATRLRPTQQSPTCGSQRWAESSRTRCSCVIYRRFFSWCCAAFFTS